MNYFKSVDLTRNRKTGEQRQKALLKFRHGLKADQSKQGPRTDAQPDQQYGHGRKDQSA